jgi:hypothetical protein
LTHRHAFEGMIRVAAEHLEIRLSRLSPGRIGGWYYLASAFGGWMLYNDIGKRLGNVGVNRKRT